MKKAILTAILGIVSVLGMAQKSLVYKADFGNANDSRLHNNATIQKHVLNLGSQDGYFDLGPDAGEIVASLDDFTISVYYKVSSENKLDGYGHFLFAFSHLAENQAEEGPYMAYRLNEERFETSTGGWNHEEIVMKGKPSDRDVWVHALFRQEGKKGQLYLNGALIGTNENMPVLKTNFKTAPQYCWIGKAPFHGDKYLTHTLVSDFRIYNRALTDKEIQKLAKKKIK